MKLKNLLWETDATGIICDDELSPAQLGNLQDALDTKVMDRTLIILTSLQNAPLQMKVKFRWNLHS